MRVFETPDGLEAKPFGKELNDFNFWFGDVPDQPAEPRLAATVMIVRDSEPGSTRYRIEDGVLPDEFPAEQNVEVFMLRRQKTMDFMPDAVVFPGGRVDPRDATPDLPWVGPECAWWAQQMNLDDEHARMVVVAAAREVFEETGVLLAGPDEHSTVDDLTDPKWPAARAALEHHEISFAEFLISERLVLRADLLGLISNWCTPPYSKKRFDTYFFSALVPAGQEPDGKTSESQIAGWVTPAYAIREADRGNWLIAAPTTFNLTQIAKADSAVEFVQKQPMFPGKVIKRGETDPDGTRHVRWHR